MVADSKLGDVVMLEERRSLHYRIFYPDCPPYRWVRGRFGLLVFDRPTLDKGTFRPAAVKEVVEPVAAPNYLEDY